MPIPAQLGLDDDDDWDEETPRVPGFVERARDACVWAIIIVGLGMSLVWLVSQFPGVR